MKTFCTKINDKIKVIKVTDSNVKQFGKGFTQAEVEKYLDPFGFLNKDEKAEALSLELAEKAKLNEANKEKVEASSIDANQVNSQPLRIEATNTDNKSKDKMPKEYGMKPKGPEPTRYGDWERNGKCVDF